MKIGQPKLSERKNQRGGMFVTPAKSEDDAVSELELCDGSVYILFLNFAFATPYEVYQEIRGETSGLNFVLF